MARETTRTLMPSRPGKSAGGLGRRVKKVAEITAVEIIRDIVDAGLQEGDQLPLEAELLERYGISRSSLREALRLLEALGLIVMRRGASKGAVVGRARPADLGRILTMYLHLLGVRYETVLDAWSKTERMLARFAAANPDRREVRERLAPYLDDDHDWPMDEAQEFHDVVSQLAGNEVLWLVLRAIGSVVSDQVVPRAGSAMFDHRLVHDHKTIAEAMIAGDVDRSGELMTEHVDHIVEQFRAFWPKLPGERVETGG